MMNLVVLQGRLTKDPEIRSTRNGSTVAGFTLAVERDWQSGGSERQTDFIDCSAWRGTAGFVERNLRKGTLVCVSGKLQSRKWQDRAGANRVSWEVEVSDCWLCGAPPAREAEPAQRTFDELADEEGGELPF